MADHYKKYKDIFDKHHGVIKASDFTSAGYHHNILCKLMKEGIVTRLKRGYYEWQEEFVSDTTIIAKLFPDAIVFLDSALFIYDYIDRTPSEWHIAVDRESRKSRFNIDYPKVKPYYISKKYMFIGTTTIEYKSQKVNIFDRDRTMCDIIRYSKKIDTELVKQAIKNYIIDSKKNIDKLMKYARALRSESKVKNMIGVWL